MLRHRCLGFSGDEVLGLFALCALCDGDIEEAAEDAFPHAAWVRGRISCPLDARGARGGDAHNVEIGRETMEVTRNEQRRCAH